MQRYTGICFVNLMLFSTLSDKCPESSGIIISRIIRCGIFSTAIATPSNPSEARKISLKPTLNLCSGSMTSRFSTSVPSLWLPSLIASANATDDTVAPDTASISLSVSNGSDTLLPENCPKKFPLCNFLK